VLRGTNDDDVICGGGVGDTISAGAGDDVIYGDPGGAQTRAQACLTLALAVNALGDDDLKVGLCHNYVTEEYPEWVGSQYNNKMRIPIVRSGGGAWPALRIVVEDLGDSVFDSVVLVDNITVSSVSHTP
jgi:Ca2+-binding RTX toxin-like protein